MDEELEARSKSTFSLFFDFDENISKRALAIPNYSKNPVKVELLWKLTLGKFERREWTLNRLGEIPSQHRIHPAM